MGRQRLAIGAHGTVRHTQAGKIWSAQTTYRDPDGTYRRITRTGTTKGLSTARLTEAIQTLSLQGGGTTAALTVGALLNRWIGHVRERDQHRPQTVEAYARTVRQIQETTFASLTVGEVTSSLASRYLAGLVDRGHPTRAVNAGGALKSAFRLAVEEDIVRRSPMTEITRPRAATPVPRALTTAEVDALRLATRTWRRGIDPRTGCYHPGPPPTELLPDTVELLLGTGMRIGEALALRWADVALGSPTRVTVAGTVVQRRGGLIRQPMPKTASGHRTLEVPGRVAEMLRQRRGNTTSEYVLASATGGLMSPANLRRQWRSAVDGTAAEGATPVLLRHTVATHLARTVGLEAASAQLGHSTIAVTRKHYVERAVPIVAHGGALEGL